jgi:RHS repeat-associated protein
MKTFYFAIVTLLSVLLSPASHAETGVPDVPPAGQSKYVMVLWEPGTPVPDDPQRKMSRVEEPNVADHGGTLIDKHNNLRIVYLPPAAARALRSHMAVAYIQRLSNDAVAEPPTESVMYSPRPRIRTDSDIDLQWGPKQYAYDGSGNIKTIGADQYQYDTVGRLISSTTGGVAETYKYDAFGNLTERATGGGATVAIPVDPASNRVAGEYDAAGNLTQGARQYEYDAFNMLVAVNGSQRRNIYDANDERIGTLNDSVTSRWMIRDFEGQVIREYKGILQPAYVDGYYVTRFIWTWELDHFIAEGRLVGGESQEFRYNEQSSQTFGGERHYHLDHLGSVRMVTNEDGRSLSENDYRPFGTTTTQSFQEQLNWADLHTDNMRFAGHWRDYLGHVGAESSEYLDYMHARYYDPQLGRFLSPDPLLGSSLQPQSWNRYAYVMNKPVDMTDPRGLYADDSSAPASGDGDVRCAWAGDIWSCGITTREPGSTPERPISRSMWEWLTGRWDSSSGGTSTLVDKAEDFGHHRSPQIQDIWHCAEGSIAPFVVGNAAILSGAAVAGTGAVLIGVGTTAAGPTYGTSLVLIPAGVAGVAAGAYLIAFGASVDINHVNNILGTNVWSPSKQWPQYFPAYPPPGANPCKH